MDTPEPTLDLFILNSDSMINMFSSLFEKFLLSFCLVFIAGYFVSLAINFIKGV